MVGEGNARKDGKRPLVHGGGRSVKLPPKEFLSPMDVAG